MFICVPSVFCHLTADLTTTVVYIYKSLRKATLNINIIIYKFGVMFRC